MKKSSPLGKYRFISVCVASVLVLGGYAPAFAQSLNPFGNPFGPIVVPQKTTRVEIGGDSARTDGKSENDFGIRLNRKVGKMATVSGSVWQSPRTKDSSPTFQMGAAAAISQRSSVWINFGGSPTSEHLPNAQYDFGGSFFLDQQLILTGAVSIRNYEGGPSVKLLVPGLVWIINPKVMIAATAINSSVSRLAPGVTAGSNSALFNLLLTPSPKLQLNIGTGYGESDFLAAASPTQKFSQNKASGNFDAAATVHIDAAHGFQLSYWLDNGNGRYKTNTLQASFFVEF